MGMCSMQMHKKSMHGNLYIKWLHALEANTQGSQINHSDFCSVLKYSIMDNYDFMTDTGVLQKN